MDGRVKPGHDDGTKSARSASRIQLPVAPEDAVLVERNPPLAFEIGLDLRPRRDAVAQRNEAGDIRLERLHPVREGVAQALNDLEQREIDIGDAPPGDIAAAIVLQQLLEIAEIFWDALFPELLA